MNISIPKQVAVLQKNLVKVFNYQLNTLLYTEDGSIYLVIEPSDGYWKGGRYPFSIEFPDDFPNNPPNVKSLDEDIPHPNIGYGSVCLNILKYDWDPSLGIVDIIQGLLFLFYEPAFDDALTDVFYDYVDCDELPFEQYVSQIVNSSIELQRNQRLSLLYQENEYVVNLSRSIVTDVIRSQIDYREITQPANPLKRRYSKNCEYECEDNEIALRKYISI